MQHDNHTLVNALRPGANCGWITGSRRSDAVVGAAARGHRHGELLYRPAPARSGTRVRATSFLNDPNADPHAFESSPQDAALVADANLVIVNGLGYDDFMQKLGASTKPDRS